MLRTRYEAELDQLNLNLIRMGAMAEKAIADAMKALNEQSIEQSEKVMEVNDSIDEMARKIESRSMKLIMKQQPVAGDLRVISTALKMITDLERIGDQAADIAEIVIMLCKKASYEKPPHIGAMEKRAVEMVRTAVDSYIKRSESLAESVIRMDDEQDELFNVVKNELINIAVNDRQRIDWVVDFLMITKYLERISDHAENIADRTLFTINGTYKNERII